MTPAQRQEWAYWLTLAFRLSGVARRAVNGLVLNADRKLQLGLMDLVRMGPEQRPKELDKYAPTLEQLFEADGKVTAQAFVLNRLLSLGCQLIPITDRSYPTHLVHRLGADRAPTLLTIAGARDLLQRPGIAISGSRKSGASGLSFARAAAQAIARTGEVVVCGLAAGIDREALEGALEAGGHVIGIAPEGVFHSRWLRRPEVTQGRLTLVSEFAPDARWSAPRAMARNKTIAGFSSALVIADCVASGGTTDQLEVHRAAGLEVFVRTGPGQGALVDELCRRPGVTPWFWSDGPATWPPKEPTLPRSAPPDVTCAVHVTNERLQIQIDAPRQLSLDAVLEQVRTEYHRVSKTTTDYPTHLPEGSPLRISDSRSADLPTETDPIRAELRARGQTGATAKELTQATGVPLHRVRRRLSELRDANLVHKTKGHHYVWGTEADTSCTATAAPQRKHPAGTTRALFPDLDMDVRTQS